MGGYGDTFLDYCLYAVHISILNGLVYTIWMWIPLLAMESTQNIFVLRPKWLLDRIFLRTFPGMFFCGWPCCSH